MLNIFKEQNGMNIVGQGGKIILFMLPSLIAAILVNIFYPNVAALPNNFAFLKPFGYLLLIPGLILWGSAVALLVTRFPKGELVTTGAYSLVRNPIYSSVGLLILPGISLLTMTWVYLLVSVFLFMGVNIFIAKEEQQLTGVFGEKYKNYMAKVDRLIPFRRP